MNKEDYVYTYTQKIISQVVSDNDDETIKAIKRYCEENDVYANLISEERLKEILELGISKKTKIDNLQSQLDTANKKLDKVKELIEENEVYNGIEYILNPDKVFKTKDILSILGE